MRLRIRSLSRSCVVTVLLVSVTGCGTDQFIGQGQLGLGGSESTGGSMNSGGSEVIGGALATGGSGNAATGGSNAATGGSSNAATGGSVTVATGGAPCDTCPSPVTCEHQGVTYAVGDVVGLCICLSDGTIGHCTGLARGCTRYGRNYAVGESFTGGCGSCVCSGDGAWTDCTGACGDCGDPALTTKRATCTSAQDSASCDAAGGVWTETLWEGTPSGHYHCACPTGDEGCPCQRAEDCVSGCYYPSDLGDIVSCNANPVGQCGQFAGGCGVVVSGSSCFAICE